MSNAGMSLLRLTFLGTSAAQPTIHRNVSGIAVKADADLLLFDCGEGSQRQMIRYGTGFAVDGVFFTHFHADHYLGIIGFLRTLGMMGREAPLTLHGPAPAKRLLHQAIYLGTDRLDFPVEIRELEGGDSVRRNGYTIRAVKVEHRISALAYVLEEDTRAGRFDLEAAMALGVPPGPLFGQLQRGVAVRLPDGREVRPEAVVGQSRPGRKLAISGDTRPCDALAEAASDADLLVHEATFADEEQKRAKETRHSTAREAADVARRAGARKLVLTHLSSRHDMDTAPLLAQAREVFAGPVEIAHDGMTVEIPIRA